VRIFLAIIGLLAIAAACSLCRQMILIIRGQAPDVYEAMPVEQQTAVRRRLALGVAFCVLVGVVLLVGAATSS
jgi:hypothetical protein